MSSDAVKVARAVLDEAIERVKAAEDARDAAIALRSVAHDEWRRALREADEQLPKVTVVFPGMRTNGRAEWAIVSRTPATIKARPIGAPESERKFRRNKRGQWRNYPASFAWGRDPYLENVDMEKSA